MPAVEAHRKALEQSQIDNAKAIAAQQAIAQQALNTSQANFTKSSQDSQNSFRDEQRAWVGVISLVGIVVKEGETPRFGVVLTNSGKTPALHMHSVVNGKSRRKGEVIVFDNSDFFPSMAKLFSDAVLQPGSQYLLQSGGGTPPMTKLQADAVTSGDNWYWVYGTITYEDVSNRKHYTNFCMIMSTDLTGGRPCNTHNEAN